MQDLARVTSVKSTYLCKLPYADMAKLANALVLGASGVLLVGSSPTIRTIDLRPPVWAASGIFSLLLHHTAYCFLQFISSVLVIIPAIVWYCASYVHRNTPVNHVAEAVVDGEVCPERRLEANLKIELTVRL